MAAENMEINQNIELEVKSGLYKGRYQSRISDLADDHLKVLVPFNKGSLVPLSKGIAISVFYAAEAAAYKFSTKVIDRMKKPVPQLIIEKPNPDDITKIQRRNYFRLEVKRKVFYRKVDQDWKPVEDFKETTTIDISGGGIKMVLSEDLPGDILLEVKLDIPDVEGVPIISKLIRTYELPDGKSAGIKFIDINHRTRDAIMGWLFDHQRKLRRKGLI